MKNPANGILLASLLAALGSCKTSTDSASSDVKNDEQLEDQKIPQRGPKQLKTLSYVFFRDNPAVRLAGNSEVTAFKAGYDALANDSMERKLLTKVFHKRQDIMALAARDTDGDGVKDYRVSQYFGKFMEGDLDLDGDGIRNIVDSDPYDSKVGGKDIDGDGQPDSDFADVNGNTVPDHVDFALLYPAASYAFSVRLSQIQVELYKSHKIILVERNEPFTLAAAEVIYDAVKRVFAKTFGKAKVLPTLRSIATEDQVLLIPEEGGETHALVSTATQTMIIYRSGLNVPDLVLLGLLVHEIGHSIQYTDDYVVSDQTTENNRIYFPNPKFFASMGPFGWKSDSSNLANLSNFKLWVPAYEYIRPEFQWKDKKPEAWFQFIDDVYSQVGDNYMTDKKVAGKNIVSQYSLTDPFEWLSDNQIAYLFAAIEQQVLSGLTTATAKKKFQTNFLKTVDAAWPGFAHYNFQDAKVRKYIAEKVPISAADLKILGERYGKPIVAKPQIVSGLSLTGDGKGGAVRCRPTPLTLP